MIKVLFLAGVVGLGVQAAAPSSPLTALRVAFSDFGTGASGAPQKKALELVGQAITSRTVGLYVVERNDHHGESTFCLERNIFQGHASDIGPLHAELTKLKAKPGEQFSLTLTAVGSCED